MEDTFDYLAEFSTTALWDPSVTKAKRTSVGPVREGSTFDVTVSFFGSTSTLQYRIVEYERPHRVVLIGDSATIVSHDEITFVPMSSGGCQVVYDANLTIRGPLLAQPAIAIAEVALAGLFNWSAGRSARGLADVLSAEQLGGTGLAKSRLHAGHV